MGRYLQIRVVAQTFRPEEAEAAWPNLSALAWPGGQTPPGGRKGVLELVERLLDVLRYGDVSKEARDALLEGAERLGHLASRLEGHLAERDPKAADQESYRLEEALDELEKRAPKR